MIESNRHRLLSLSFTSTTLLPTSLDHFDFDPSFSRLEHLALDGCDMGNLLGNCFILNSLPRLLSLYITAFRLHRSEMGQMINSILPLPVLKRCIIRNPTIVTERGSNFVLPTVIEQKPSSVEYLVMDNTTSPRTIVSLLKYLPNIRHFKCRLFERSGESNGELATINLPHLKRLSIVNEFIDLNHIEALMKSIGHHVEVFKVSGNFGGLFSDTGRWEQMIKTYLPHLKVFDMKHQEVDYRNRFSINGCVNHFCSQF